MSTDTDEIVTVQIKASPKTIGEQLRPTFQRLYNNALFSDIEVEFGSKKIHAHKTILSLFSPIFKSKISADAKVLKLENEERCLDLMFSFVYKGNLEKISEQEALALLELAHAYKIDVLKVACGNFLADLSSSDNLSFLINIANKYECDTLKHRCGIFVAENFASMLKSGTLFELDVEIWKGIVMAKKVKAESEEQIFEAVQKYCSQFGKESDAVFSKLVPYIQFNALDPKYLVEVVEKQYQNHPLIHEKLYAAFKHHVNPKSLDPYQREYDGPSWHWKQDYVSLSHTSTHCLQRSINNNSGNKSAIGSKPLSSISPKTWSIKVDKMETGGWIGIGVGPENCVKQSFTGSERMWMCSANSYMWPAQRMEGFAFGPGDTITVSLEGQKLHFKKNGSPTGKALEGFLSEFGADKIYPLVTVQRAQVTLLDRYTA